MKRLSPKFINRAIVGLAMLAPIIYLFGALFCGLIGAHGSMPYGEETEVSYRSVDGNGGNVALGVSMKFELNADKLASYTGANFAEGFNFISNNVPMNRITLNASGDVLYRRSAGSSFTVYTASTGVFSELYKVAYFVSDDWLTLSNSSRNNMLNICDVFEAVYSPVSSSEYVFDQFFDKDNWVKSMGEETLKDNPRGFAPFAYLIDYIDDNMLHLSTSQVGLMGYGYLYWCAHVLLFDLLFYISVFFIRLIKSVLNKFERTDY